MWYALFPGPAWKYERKQASRLIRVRFYFIYEKENEEQESEKWRNAGYRVLS